MGKVVKVLGNTFNHWLIVFCYYGMVGYGALFLTNSAWVVFCVMAFTVLFNTSVMAYTTVFLGSRSADITRHIYSQGYAAAIEDVMVELDKRGIDLDS